MNHINRSLLNLTLATVLSTLAAGTAVAEPAAKAAPTSPSSFKDYDSNGDGSVSQEEFSALGGDEQTFRKADANSDNMLSSDELAKASANKGRS